MSYSQLAADLIETYGNYPIAIQFASTDAVPDLPESENPAYGAAFDVDPSAKRHAACDECRKRKLKCSGDPSGCARCLKQNLTCHYSAQKQMGRPRKRQKTDEASNTDDVDASLVQPNGDHAQFQRPSYPPVPLPPPVHEPVIDPELSEQIIERTNFENTCPGAISQSIRRSAAQVNSSQPDNWGSGMTSQGSSSTSPHDAPRTPSDGDVVPNVVYPTDVSLWPDFSDMTMLPMLVQDSHEYDKVSYSGANGSTDSRPEPYSTYPTETDQAPSTLTQLPAVPPCPCLPNLYLTLSTLSTLSAFPVSSGTIDTLLSAHRTGRGVLYCAVCPQKMQTGSQNVMLSSMLITVLADHWHRVKKANAMELRSGFTNSSESGEDPNSPMSVREDLEWRTFGYNLVRAYVFGDKPTPVPPTQIGNRPHVSISPTPTPTAHAGTSTSLYTLHDLVSALERRQKQWHNVAPFCHTNEFPSRLENPHAHDHRDGYAVGMTLEDLEACEAEARTAGDDGGRLCLRIVRHATMMMRSLDGPVPCVEAQ